MNVLPTQSQNTLHNPAGTDGFAFIEFTSADQSLLHSLFKQLGFSPLSHHKEKPLTWYHQGGIYFLVNDQPYGFTEKFESVHGPSACAMGFKVQNAREAYQHAMRQGARSCKPKMLEFQVPAIYGIGDSVLYLVDDTTRETVYEDLFYSIADVEGVQDVGLKLIDHLTHNVYRGHMDKWARFYEKTFSFYEMRYFKIQGEHTGLLSRAMTSPCGKIKIPINESRDQSSQIEEFLNEYKGEGIQHIALTTNNIIETVSALRENGIQFMDVPDSYYDMIDERLPGHQQDVNKLREHQILLDGYKQDNQWHLLLQIFTAPLIGPIFFEIIQRLGDEGFGEGNFQALFEAMERDQVKRGVLKVE